MPALAFTVPHSLPPAEALKRTKKLLQITKTEYKDQFSDLEESWDGMRGIFSARVMGFALSGTLLVTKDSVELTGKVPWAALPFKGKIEAAIREKAEEVLG